MHSPVQLSTVKQYIAPLNYLCVKIILLSLFFQVPVTSWFDDPNDMELLDLIPFFEALDKVDNVLTVLGRSQLQQTPSPTSSQNDPSLQDPQQEEL